MNDAESLHLIPIKFEYLLLNGTVSPTKRALAILLIIPVEFYSWTQIIA